MVFSVTFQRPDSCGASIWILEGISRPVQRGNVVKWRYEIKDADMKRVWVSGASTVRTVLFAGRTVKLVQTRC